MFQSNPTSNCNSPSSDKENAEKDENVASPKKWVPPKVCVLTNYLVIRQGFQSKEDPNIIHVVVL